MRRLLGAAVLAPAIAGMLIWGCATSQPITESRERPVDFVPDGGWQNYRPDQVASQPDPMRAASGTEPHVSPYPAVPTGIPPQMH